MQGAAGDPVDAPGQAVAGRRHRLHRLIFEDPGIASGQAQPVLDVAADLVPAEALQRAAQHDALRQRRVRGHFQPSPQLGEPDQQQAQPVLGIHPVVGHDPQLLEDVVVQVMGLVEDQHRELLRLGGEARHGIADRPVAGRPAGEAFKAEGAGDHVAAVQDAAGGQRDIADAIAVRGRFGHRLAAERGLAAARFPGRQPDAAQVQKMADARAGLAGGGAVKEFVGAQRGVEGIVLEGKVRLVH